MKKYYLSFLVTFLILFSVCHGIAVPVRPLGPVDISGTVSELNWVPEKKIKAVRGISGSAGKDRTFPAHFLVTLEDFEGVDRQTATTMTRYLDGSALKDQEKCCRPSFILIKINHTDKSYLKKGMRIKVSGYTVRGDEGGTGTYFTGIDVMKNSKLCVLFFSGYFSPGFAKLHYTVKNRPTITRVICVNTEITYPLKLISASRRSFFQTRLHVAVVQDFK